MGASTEDLRALVEGHEPASPREVAARRALPVRAGAAWPTPATSTPDPTHVTASGIVVGRRGTVLHRHKRLGIWMQPGGHIDAGETPDEAARREATEELGLAVAHPGGRPAPHPPRRPRGGLRPHPPRPALPAPRRRTTTRTPRPGESPDARWCGWDEAMAMADAGAGRRAAPGPGRLRGPAVTDTLAHLLAVQDLDTSITQLQHRRDALAEASGLAAVEAELRGAGGRAVRRRGAPRRAGGHPEGPRGADRRHHRAPHRHRAAHVRRHQLVGARPAGHERRGAAPDRAPGRARGAGAGGHARPGPRRRRAGRAARAHGARWRPGPTSSGRRSATTSSRSTPSWRRPSGPGRPRPRCSRPRCPTATRRCGRACKGTGAARLIKNRCDGCHLELSSVEVERIRALPPGEVATCEQCGRILVPV